MNYNEVVVLRKLLTDQFSKSSLAKNKQVKSISDLINGITGINKFITVYHFKQKKFIYHYQIHDILGYTDNEFTIEAVNNSNPSPIHVIHPDDIEHKLRYDLILYQILADGVTISSLADNYEISLRIIDKENNIKRVKRQSYIFETDKNGVPTSQLDIWKVIPNDHPYVKVQLHHSTNEMVDEYFYKKNRTLLNFEISNRQIEILKLRNQRLDNKSIAQKLHISVKTVENHIHNVKKKMQEFCDKRKVTEPIYNMNDMLHFVRKYNIFSFVVT